MTNGYFASGDVEGQGTTPAAMRQFAPAFHAVLERHAASPLSSTELRAGLRPLVRRARETGYTIEQLLVLVKREWLSIPGTRGQQGERGEATRRLERAVTQVIETYYEA